MTETERLCLEAMRAVQKMQNDYYLSLARVNLLLFPAAMIGFFGILFIIYA